MKSSNWRKVTPAQNSGKQAEAFDSLCLALLRRGVSAKASGAVAKQVQGVLEGLDATEAGRVLDAVALAFASGTHQVRDELAAGSDGRGAQRLAEDLGCEVRKLDEIVKVLNAYLVRLRSPREPARERRLQ